MPKESELPPGTVRKGTYVYGILPADIELAEEVPGVGNPPGQLRVIRYGSVAALVSDVDLSRPLGTPDDLSAHEQVLDGSAAEVPVLPMRFGAVLTDDDAVADDLLAGHEDELAAELARLEGRAEYIVRGRYDEQAIVAEVLSESREAARLRAQIAGKDPDATRDARIRLGEMISGLVAEKREQDTLALGEQMEGRAAASVVRDPTHERDAVHVAFLLDRSQDAGLQEAVAELAKAWEGRVQLRLLGPLAAYDFVGAAQEA
jgi:Gas vesicle synthesis protein GvpL/GvpF